jgi:hypothetical protein
MTSLYIGQYEDAGSRNAFYRLKDRRYGFKEFENKSCAIFAHNIQKKLADKNLAPRVYSEVGRIRIPNMNNDSLELSDWGYITEIARTMDDCDDEYCDGECFESDCANSMIIDEVLNNLREEGLGYVDHHRGNFGYVRRNKTWVPVVIDVGSESFEYVNEDIYGDLWPESGDGYNNYEIGCDCSDCRRHS